MSLRDRLRGRDLPTETVRFPADRLAWTAAHDALEEEAAAVQDALRRGAEPDRAARDAAQAVVDDLAVHTFTVRALTPSDWEALVAQHPAQRDEDQTNGFHPETFWPALLAETVTSDDDSMTAEEWTEVFASGELTAGEKNTLTQTAWRLNTTAWLVPTSVGKDSAQTRS